MSSNPRYENYSKRRRLRKQILFEEDHCWICGDIVDVTLPPQTPASPEIDEILPISLGGSPTDRENTRLSHRLCNQKRGNKLPNEAIELAKQRAKNAGPLKKSRDW